MLIDNFEQYFLNFVFKVQNAQKSAQHKINSLNTFKNELVTIFRGFRVFEYALWQKNENPETPEINRKFSKSKKHSVLSVYRY